MCRDLVILPSAPVSTTAWAETAESIADEYAAQKGAASALDLASALVKIAKLVPAGMTPVLPAGAYLVEDGDDISSHVEHLIRLAEQRSNFGLAGPTVLARRFDRCDLGPFAAVRRPLAARDHASRCRTLCLHTSINSELW